MHTPKIVSFGEIMLRLTPSRYRRFNQSLLFEAGFGGSEANVAVSLANYGLRSEFVSCLPANRIADACIDDLRSFGVGTSHIRRDGNRIGLYYMEKRSLCGLRRSCMTGLVRHSTPCARDNSIGKRFSAMRRGSIGRASPLQ